MSLKARKSLAKAHTSMRSVFDAAEARRSPEAGAKREGRDFVLETQKLSMRSAAQLDSPTTLRAHSHDSASPFLGCTVQTIHATHTQYTRITYVIHTQCTRNSHAIHMQHTCTQHTRTQHTQHSHLSNTRNALNTRITCTTLATHATYATYASHATHGTHATHTHTHCKQSHTCAHTCTHTHTHTHAHARWM